MQNQEMQNGAQHQEMQMKQGRYWKFILMTAVSTLIMHLISYTMVFKVDHVYFSAAMFYMALMMGAAMAIVMLLFMMKMYPDKRKNMLIFVVSAAVFVLAFIMFRTQAFIGDKAYMRAMIPHHSMAILTSERAAISNPEVRELADQIIASQQEEIRQMKELLNRIEP